MRVYEQNRSYRRGVLLGLTMAEIVILLLFCLLLALKFMFDKELEEQAKRLRFLEKVSSEEVSAFVAEMQKQYPEVKSLKDLAERLKQAALDSKVLQSESDPSQSNLKNAQLGKAIREKAAKEGVSPEQLAARVMERLTSHPGEPLVDEWPPFLNLSEADGYFFAVGSAELAPEFKGALSGKIADILHSLVKEHRISVVEVVGHTDEQPIQGISNLDASLVASLNGRPAQALRSSDNAGLGMARAVATVKVLQRDKRFSNIALLPLSAAQAIYPADQLASGSQAGDAPKRRRVEIRLRRASKEYAAKKN